MAIPNKVNAKEIKEAIDYFWHEGYINELKYDQKVYVDALLRAAGNILKIKLKGNIK